MKNRRGLFILLILLGFHEGGSAQPMTPLLFVTPKQLVIGGKTLEGQRVKMEVAFAYRASIQPDSSYQKCTMEGKFRETHRSIDEIVLYEIYVPNGIFLKHSTSFQQGEHLTIVGNVAEVDGFFTKVFVEEVKAGWLSDHQKVLRDTATAVQSSLNDSLITTLPQDSVIQEKKAVTIVTKDTSLQKKDQDSSWIK